MSISPNDQKQKEYDCPNCEEEKPGYRDACPKCEYEDKKFKQDEN